MFILLIFGLQYLVPTFLALMALPPYVDEGSLAHHDRTERGTPRPLHYCICLAPPQTAWRDVGCRSGVGAFLVDFWSGVGWWDVGWGKRVFWLSFGVGGGGGGEAGRGWVVMGG